MSTWLTDLMTVTVRDYGSFALLLTVTAACGGLEAAKPAFRSQPRRPDRWPANIALLFINISVAAAMPVSAWWAATLAERSGFGLFNAVSCPWWVVVPGTIAAISLAEYVQHVISHKIPIVWRVHRVHHLDTHLDVSTAGRHHPLELLVSLLATVPVVVALGLDRDTLVAYFIVASLMSACAHANVRLPAAWDRITRLVFVTPNMHAIHHSARYRETDSNYGEVFTIWDRLFGTYRSVPPERYDAMVIGLNEVRDERADDLWWQLRSPFLGSLRPEPPRQERPTTAVAGGRAPFGDVQP